MMKPPWTIWPSSARFSFENGVASVLFFKEISSLLAGRFCQGAHTYRLCARHERQAMRMTGRTEPKIRNFR
jgi:hypothetical protein